MFNRVVHCFQRFARILMSVALLFCVGCNSAYYTVEGNLNTKYLVIHDGDKEIKIDMSTGEGGNLSGDVVAGDGSFELEIDGVSMVGSVTTLGSVQFSSVIYKGKELGLGSMMDM